MQIRTHVSYGSNHAYKIKCLPPLQDQMVLAHCQVTSKIHVLKHTLILSVSMAVLAMRILAFSRRLGWFTPIFLSSRKPIKEVTTKSTWVSSNQPVYREEKTLIFFPTVAAVRKSSQALAGARSHFPGQHLARIQTEAGQRVSDNQGDSKHLPTLL